ncbi:MAG TPA: zf-TFIIB domain-containing protein, partial [Oligoflexia bacterium]|nr:zf-TFIIB domain-containing protein [Oligoflexia bacterium]
MNCPACSSKLTPQNAGNLELDVCTESCGGIWFDAGELEKLDHADENAADSLLRPLTNQKVPLDRARGRQCPKCPGTSLARQFYDSQYEIEIDYCLRCGGI